jgi:hypothetical protein
MANHDVQEDDYECNISAIRPEDILRELTNVARTAFRRGYGTIQLIFSDWSFVSGTDSGVIRELEALLRAGHKPLGFIAPDRARNRNPFVEAWEMGDNAALAELRYLAHSIYWHLLPARNAQLNAAVRRNGGDLGK